MRASRLSRTLIAFMLSAFLSILSLSISFLSISFLALLCIAMSASPAAAQKKGGTLRLYHNDNPPSTSLLEESTIASVTPFAAIFNNLVVFDPAKLHESLDTVIPDLAESWSWDATNTRLTFKLRQGVKWHDGQPFTAKDVQCTWRMLIGKGDDAGLPPQPAQGLVLEAAGRLDQRRLRGDLRAERAAAEPAGAARERLLAGLSLPCAAAGDAHQADRHRAVQAGRVQARRHSIRLVRNPDYFKKDRPYLDEITFRIIDNRATRMLAFSTGEFDITFPSDVTIPLMKDIKARAPNAICETIPTGTQINLMVNRVNPPFDNPDIRNAMSLALDRKPFNTILMEGQALIGGAHAAEARRRMGHAAGDGVVADRLWSRHRQEHRRSAGDHAEARLQRRQAAADQDPDPQPADLSRSRRHRHRPAQEDLHQRRARYSRHAALVHAAGEEGLHHRA